MSKLYVYYVTTKVEYNGRWYIASLKDNEGSVIIKVEYPKEFKYCTEEERKTHFLNTRTIGIDQKLSYNALKLFEIYIIDLIEKIESILIKQNL